MNRPLKLTVCFLLLSSGVRVRGSTGFYCLDQEGFYPNTHKIALVTRAANSSPATRIVGFSRLTRVGTFRFAVPGNCTSCNFRTDENVHHPNAVASLKAFYSHRIVQMRQMKSLPIEMHPLVYLENAMKALEK